MAGRGVRSGVLLLSTVGTLWISACGGRHDPVTPAMALSFSQQNELEETRVQIYANDERRFYVHRIITDTDTKERTAGESSGRITAEQRDLIDSLMTSEKRQHYSADEDCDERDDSSLSGYFVRSEVHDQTTWCFLSKEGVSATTRAMLDQLEVLEETLWQQGTRTECTSNCEGELEGVDVD